MHGSVGEKARGDVVGSCSVDLPAGVFSGLSLRGWEVFYVVVGVVVDVGYQA